MCYGKMGWKYRLVKEFQLLVMMCHYCIMSILLYHPGSIVMGQNLCCSLKFCMMVLILRPSALPFQPLYPTSGPGQDSAAVKYTHGPCGCPKNHITSTPIAVIGLHIRHGISFVGMPYMWNRGSCTVSGGM